jgi:hypothetical protein
MAPSSDLEDCLNHHLKAVMEEVVMAMEGPAVTPNQMALLPTINNSPVDPPFHVALVDPQSRRQR